MIVHDCHYFDSCSWGFKCNTFPMQRQCSWNSVNAPPRTEPCNELWLYMSEHVLHSRVHKFNVPVRFFKQYKLHKSFPRPWRTQNHSPLGLAFSWREGYCFGLWVWRWPKKCNTIILTTILRFSILRRTKNPSVDIAPWYLLALFLRFLHVNY